MKVYRLEHIKSGKGPFTEYVEGLYVSWLDSHYPPMDICSPVHHEYLRWIDSITPGRTELPFCCYFAFTTLKQLKKCFRGYENYPQLALMEYTIDTADDSDFCILSDGQVIFSEVISKQHIV